VPLLLHVSLLLLLLHVSLLLMVQAYLSSR
jgi:hypothetical protein